MTYQVIACGGWADGRTLYESGNLWACQTLALAIDKAWSESAEADRELEAYYKNNHGCLGAIVVDDSGNTIEY